MSVKATCKSCGEDDQDCVKIGKHLVCTRCQGIYNDVRPLVLDATMAPSAFRS